LASTFFSTLNEIQDELSGVRSEITRMRAIERAVAIEREPWQLLN